MSTANPCTTIVLPTCRPLPLRWAQVLREQAAQLLRRWRDYSNLLAQQRALSALSDRTLHDIGLAERRFDERTLSAIDWERGRW